MSAALRARHRSGHDQHARHLFDRDGRARATAQVPITQIYPAPAGRARPGGDLAARAPSRTCRAAPRSPARSSPSASPISARRRSCGSGRPASPRQRHRLAGPPHRRRFAPTRAEGWEPHVAEETGLVIDPYFSATKLAWLLDMSPGARPRARPASSLRHRRQLPAVQADRRQAACHRRHQRRAHHALQHQVRRVGRRLLDRLRRAARHAAGSARQPERLRQIEPEHFGAAIPIMGVAGDQQAAAYGQACFTPGMIKATYGTGCFVLANTGEEKVASATRMLATIFYQLEGRRNLCARGRDLHGGRDGAVAPRQSRPVRYRRGERGAGATRRT